MKVQSETTLDNKIRKKLVIVGDGAIGKTALLMVQSGEEYPEAWQVNLGIYTNNL
jgi:GTPase SAR1 family protein